MEFAARFGPLRRMPWPAPNLTVGVTPAGIRSLCRPSARLVGSCPLMRDSLSTGCRAGRSDGATTRPRIRCCGYSPNVAAVLLQNGLSMSDGSPGCAGEILRAAPERRHGCGRSRACEPFWGIVRSSEGEFVHSENRRIGYTLNRGGAGIMSRTVPVPFWDFLNGG